MPKRNKIPRTPIAEQEPSKRRSNFDEVALGYTEDEAITEASRCLQCKNPRCIDGCPVGIDIKSFIDLISQKRYDEALERIRETNSLPAICGRVCPQEDQCEKTCILGIRDDPVAIGRLERFVADNEDKTKKHKKKIKSSRKGIKAAVIGSGPAGLTCAGELAKMGYDVTLFEALHKAGGVLVYGIPEFRLPKSILEREIEFVKSLGVDIEFNMVIGKIFTIDELLNEGYRSVFIATGAGLPYFMGIGGENLNGVYSANEYLTRSNLMKAYRFPEWDTPIKKGGKVVVVGGGNVAMDSARTALRLGADKVYLVYRRSEKEMPARDEEIEHAKQEGIDFMLLTNPIEIIGDEGWVSRVRCIRMELGEKDASGRQRPLAIEGSEFELEADTVVIAIGQGPNPLLTSKDKDIKLNKKGNIIADPDTLKTSKKGVFAGGDIVTGAATVILAMGAGKVAARSMDEYMRTGIF